MQLKKEFKVQKEKMVLIGIALPLLHVGAFFGLVWLSFIGPWFNPAIAVDKLILLTVAMSPIVYLLGIVVSTIALLKSQTVMIALKGIALNAALLAVLLYFGRSFLVEFQLVV